MTRSAPDDHPLRLFARMEWVLVLLSGLTLGLILIDFPQAFDQSLDAGWQVALVEAHLHHRQFGSDLIYTFGPWGWLLSHFFPDAALGAKDAWEIGAKTGLALALAASALGWSRPRRWAYLILLLLLGGLFADTVFFLFIAVAVLTWLMPAFSPSWRTILVTAALGFLAETKFTYTLLIVGGVGLAVLARMLARDRRGAGWIAGTFLVVFLAGWLAAGQSLAHLPIWVAQSWEVSSAYPQAMNLDEAPPVFFCGLAVIGLSAGLMVLGVRRAAGRRQSGPALAFAAAALFLAWKHGFVRADGHTVGFFAFAAPFSLVWPARLSGPCRTRWFIVSPFSCLLGFWFADPALFRYMGENVRQRLAMNAQLIAHPADRRAGFRNALQENERKLALPAARAQIGKQPVDIINYEQGYVFANHLNYDPRPVLQSFSAYSPELLERNAEFFRSAAAPEFVLLQYSVLDQRFPTQDDSVTLAELPLRYTLAARQEICLLLARRPGAAPPPQAREMLSSQRPRFGDQIPLPSARDHALWLQADLPLSFWGRLRALFYKPPIMTMTATDDAGGQTRHRVIAEIAREGFVIQPFLETQDDFGAFLQGQGDKWLRSVAFTPAPGESRWWGRPTVRFFRLPALPMAAVSPYGFLTERGLANFTPQRISSPVATEVFKAGPDWAVLVHAPGEIDLTPAPTSRRIGGHFGLREGSYSGASRTDGVEFSVEFVDAAGRSTTVWHRLLQPLSQPGDRGSQSFSAELPATGVKAVVLRTGVGPRGDGNWDWSYWSDLHLDP